ncbi:MAG: hypothetical protein WCX65_00255 [bacterium]
MKRFFSAIVLTAAALSFLAAPASSKDIKYALAILHYNLQYVAGDTEIENKIIVQSLDPVLDFFLAHPDWGVDVEMQGYMIEETAKRYPAIFEKLKTLVNRRQIDLVSFHYADQLFLAYPRLDTDWSDRINKKVFEKHGLIQSTTVFTQEGQFGEGLASFMADKGFKTLVLPKNLYRYAHGEKNAAPYYRLNNTYVVIGAKGVDYEGEASVHTAWSYMDDAELLPTGRATPYSIYFKYKPEKMKEYEDELKGLETQGYKIGTIANYVAELKEAGVKPAQLEPMFDGDWQPKDTDSLFRWMGDYRAQFERDNEILTANVRVRHKLAAAQIIIDYLRDFGFEKDAADLEPVLAEAWRLQCQAEVSDSTGWTPMPVEIKYSQTNSAGANALAEKIANRAKELLKTKTLTVNIASGELTLAAPAESKRPETACPVDYKLTGDIEKKSHACFKISDNITQLDVKFKTTNWFKNNTRLIFPRKTDFLIYSPSLLEDAYVKYPTSAFKSETGSFYIPASNGLIALDDDLFIIKKTDIVHVSPRFGFDEPTISFDMRKPPNGVHSWTFYFFRGTPEDAVRFANKTNVFPTVVLGGEI